MTRAFVVHRRDSGEVVHVHLHPSDLEIEVDEILTMVDPSHDAQLEVVEVPADQLPRGGFAVQKGRLVEQKEAGAGAGGTDVGEHGERSYEDVRRREPS